MLDFVHHYPIHAAAKKPSNLGLYMLDYVKVKVSTSFITKLMTKC